MHKAGRGGVHCYSLARRLEGDPDMLRETAFLEISVYQWITNRPLYQSTQVDLQSIDAQSLVKTGHVRLPPEVAGHARNGRTG